MTSLTYHEMIENALFALGERKGSTRTSIWKYISTQYPAADYKQYLIRFKKIDDDKNIIKVDKMRLKLTPNFRKSVIKKLAKGEAGSKTKKTKATTKAASKRKGAAKKMGGSKAKKTGSKAKSGKKNSKASANKKGSGKASGAKKGMAKAKVSAGKKTKGSKKVQQKKMGKKAMNNKKAQKGKAKNTRASMGKKGGKTSAASKAGKKGGSAASKRKQHKQDQVCPMTEEECAAAGNGTACDWVHKEPAHGSTPSRMDRSMRRQSAQSASGRNNNSAAKKNNQSGKKSGGRKSMGKSQASKDIKKNAPAQKSTKKGGKN